ncbi:hypothetical protein C2U72_13045 [Prosthecomicrobium hirschii]|uniref:hypothetical protein n=1 Tax=Prosthecodimorpha hirschii TaxID=665126 RepID=UPI00112EE5BE|nr:hypothetical protein [Prosthecomicrobium hirschii]TPQ50498.1 hypothetical protein C2U72_13045 [Prosthecomicrobium hirschii]
MDAAREALNTLLGSFIGFAEQMLEQHGEFYPYAGAMKPSGEVVSIGHHDGDEKPPRIEALESLRGFLAAEAGAGRIDATALFYDCRVSVPDSDAITDAIAVELDHRSGSSLVCYLPYRLADGTLETGDIFANEGANAVFGAG